MPEIDDVVTLVYEDGEEETFAVEDVMEFEGNTYVVLVPADADSEAREDEEVEACIFRVETDEDGEEVLVDLDDDEYEKVTGALCADLEEACDEGEDEDEFEEEDEDDSDLDEDEDDALDSEDDENEDEDRD
ncbi:MAG: DUF1292 domain-containing protein [Firmicutes bacterium]|nr:DUF1292 domain-containing protein [Bacillota bacterium]MDH7495599.1 DUF1292 domain-containing protein [Bacillota bacterium]